MPHQPSLSHQKTSQKAIPRKPSFIGYFLDFSRSFFLLLRSLCLFIIFFRLFRVDIAQSEGGKWVLSSLVDSSSSTTQSASSALRMSDRVDTQASTEMNAASLLVKQPATVSKMADLHEKFHWLSCAQTTSPTPPPDDADIKGENARALGLRSPCRRAAGWMAVLTSRLIIRPIS